MKGTLTWTFVLRSEGRAVGSELTWNMGWSQSVWAGKPRQHSLARCHSWGKWSLPRLLVWADSATPLQERETCISEICLQKWGHLREGVEEAGSRAGSEDNGKGLQTVESENKCATRAELALLSLAHLHHCGEHSNGDGRKATVPDKDSICRYFPHLPFPRWAPEIFI